MKFIYHDSFRNDVWDGFLTNCSNVALDWHIYQAWDVQRHGDQFLSKKSTSEQGVQQTELKSYPYSNLKGGLSTGNIMTKYYYESIENSQTTSS